MIDFIGKVSYNYAIVKEGTIMLEKFLYKCPECMAEESIETGKNGRITCKSCNAVFSYTEDWRLKINRKKSEDIMTLREAYAKISSAPLAKKGIEAFTAKKGEVLWAKSDRAELFREQEAGVFHGYRRIRAQLFCFSLIDAGKLYLTNKRLYFQGTKEYEIGLDELSSVTIESHNVLMNTRRGYAFAVSFKNESGKKWEDYIRKAVRDFYHTREIVEFHPRITFH
jgi:hypothetical protein